MRGGREKMDLPTMHSIFELGANNSYKLRLSRTHKIYFKFSYISSLIDGCRHQLTLVPLSRIFLPWRRRWYVPPKRQFTKDLHGATSQKTALFIVTVLFLKNCVFDYRYGLQYINCIWLQYFAYLLHLDLFV
jgi:hypothetical protein